MSFKLMNNIEYAQHIIDDAKSKISTSIYKVGIYIRLSKEDEEKEKYSESESIGNQRTLLMQYIKENKLNFVKEYVDDGVSRHKF